MRTYLINSPQAAARIVALAMLADGLSINPTTAAQRNSETGAAYV